MRVVLDTNVYLRALLSRVSPASRILAAWREQRFELLTCTAQLGELADVLTRPAIRRILPPHADIDAIVQDLWKLAVPVELRHPYPQFDRDAGDAWLLATLRDGLVDVLVTEDHDLLDLGEYSGTRIVQIREFQRLLKR